jgi:hypothetical protein
MTAQNHTTKKRRLSILPVLKPVTLASAEPWVPTIPWDDEPRRRRRRSESAREHDLAETLAAACIQIHYLEAQIAVLERVSQG